MAQLQQHKHTGRCCSSETQIPQIPDQEGKRFFQDQTQGKKSKDLGDYISTTRGLEI